MSTPQGPNGAGQGQPGRKPEDRNGQEVTSAPSGAATSQGPATQASAPQDRPTSPQGGGQPDQPASANTSGAAAKSESTPSEAGSKDAVRPSAASQPVSPQADHDGKPVAPAKADTPAPNADQTRPVRPGQVSRPGGQTPPWQRAPQGAQQGAPAPQSTPQTNLPGVGPGLSKVDGGRGTSAQRPSSSGVQSTQAQPTQDRPTQDRPSPTKSAATQTPPTSQAPTRPVVTGTAAASMNSGASGAGSAARTADRAAAAKAKAAIIDGPTRHIERKDLAKDLPDLSSVKHPAPSVTTTAENPQVAAVGVSAASAAVAAGEPLRATVQLRRIDPWSMLKISSVISVSLFFVWMIAVGLLYGVLAGMGVWDRLNSAFTDIVSDAGSDGLVTVGQVFGYATVIGLANMVLMTALATLGAFIYNLCTDLVGGVQVTLADPD